VNLDQWAETAVASLPADVRETLVADPHGALRKLGLTTSENPSLTARRADGGACDGVSFLQDGVVLYAPTPNSRRENFTVAHEVGHWLVDHRDEILDWLANQREPAAMLETLCDRIAQRLLLPPPAVTAVVRDGPVRAGHVLKLYDATEASRQACAIAVASRLTRLGAVAIINTATGEVDFASINPDPEEGWPAVFPWRGQTMPPGHHLVSLRAAGATMTRKSHWQNPWGDRQPYYIDAVTDGRRIFAVFSDTDIWNVERLHLDPQREFLHRPTGEVTCCGATHTVRGYPCGDCGGHYCPTCGKCQCQRQADREVLCRGRCFMKYAPHLLVDGLCEECR
jgi:hypothetical protein